MATLLKTETVSIEQAAAVLGISRRSAYRYAKTGEIPVVRLGGRLLVPKHRLIALLEGEKPDAGEAAA